MKTRLSLAFFWFILCAASVQADVRLAAIFNDGIVLQRGRPVPIWGRADADETVTVRFAGQTGTVIANQDGRWRVNLGPLRASATPAVLAVEGKNRLEVKNVLVGEVWMCAGQSNMAFKLADATGGKEDAAKADFPTMRVFAPAHKLATVKGQDVSAQWVTVSPQPAGGMTAVGFYFGRDLQEKLKVPVGLIDTSWGSTSAEAWTPIEYLAAHDELRSTIEIMKVWEKERDTVKAKFDQQLADWRTASEQAKSEGRPAPERPIVPDALRPERAAGILYDSLIEPLIPYALRGVIWYQGENNAGRAKQYRVLLPTMIRAWRERWGAGAFDFGIVQLPGRWPPPAQPEDRSWSHLRDAQLYTYQTVARTGLIVTTDVGDAYDGHPKNKKPVGERLARWALADAYGFKLVKAGPVYASYTVRGKEIVITFKDTGGGLKSLNNQELKWFAIAGADRVWHWAQAKIIGKDTVAVWSSEVAAPVAARYAWVGNPAGANLTNDSGLPASPFRTDDWPEGKAK